MTDSIANINNLTPKEYLSHLELFGTEQDRKTVEVISFPLEEVESLENQTQEDELLIDQLETEKESLEDKIDKALDALT